MKKIISLIILIFIFPPQGFSVRCITGLDIARWYLDSDLVLICSVNKIETIIISEHDSLVEDGYHLKYKTIREKYTTSTDSIIKGEKRIDNKMDSIFTPAFSTSAIREKKEFDGFDTKGDSTFLNHLQISDNFNDYSYFRIPSLFAKYLMILRKTKIGYEIEYVNNCETWLLDLIKEVKSKGENYFPFPNSQKITDDSIRAIRSN